MAAVTPAPPEADDEILGGLFGLYDSLRELESIVTDTLCPANLSGPGCDR